MARPVAAIPINAPSSAQSRVFLGATSLPSMVAERGIEVDYSTVQLLPVLANAFRLRKRPVGQSWRMDETYIHVRVSWKSLHRTTRQ